MVSNGRGGYPSISSTYPLCPHSLKGETGPPPIRYSLCTLYMVSKARRGHPPAHSTYSLSTLYIVSSWHRDDSRDTSQSTPRFHPRLYRYACASVPHSVSIRVFEPPPPRYPLPTLFFAKTPSNPLHTLFFHQNPPPRHPIFFRTYALFRSLIDNIVVLCCF